MSVLQACAAASAKSVYHQSIYHQGPVDLSSGISKVKMTPEQIRICTTVLYNGMNVEEAVKAKVLKVFHIELIPELKKNRKHFSKYLLERDAMIKCQDELIALLERHEQPFESKELKSAHKTKIRAAILKYNEFLNVSSFYRRDILVLRLSESVDSRLEKSSAEISSLKIGTDFLERINTQSKVSIGPNDAEGCEFLLRSAIELLELSQSPRESKDSQFLPFAFKFGFSNSVVRAAYDCYADNCADLLITRYRIVLLKKSIEMTDEIRGFYTKLKEIKKKTACFNQKPPLKELADTSDKIASSIEDYLKIVKTSPDEIKKYMQYKKDVKVRALKCREQFLGSFDQMRKQAGETTESWKAHIETAKVALELGRAAFDIIARSELNAETNEKALEDLFNAKRAVPAVGSTGTASAVAAASGIISATGIGLYNPQHVVSQESDTKALVEGDVKALAAANAASSNRVGRVSAAVSKVNAAAERAAMPPPAPQAPRAKRKAVSAADGGQDGQEARSKQDKDKKNKTDSSSSSAAAAAKTVSADKTKEANEE